MKKIIILMLLALVFVLFGCRQENLLLENEKTTSASEQFSFKIIKVDKSNALFSDPHLQAMTDSEGETASVDMDQVIHIQKGSVNSYTFKVLSSESNAPFQNIVITEFPNGVVTKKLITFSLTDAEKVNALKGEYIDFQNKVSSIQNFNGSLAQFSVNTDDDCIETISIDLPCGSTEHTGASQIAQCTHTIKPKTVYKYIDTCGSSGGSSIGSNPWDGTGSPPNYSTGTSPAGSEGENISEGNPYNPDIIISSPNIPNKEFVNFVNSLSADLKFTAQHSDNIDFYWGLNSYFFLNNQSQEAKNFINWALQFKKDNWWTVSWAQFQNWFIEEPILNNTLQNELFEDWADPNRVKPTTRFKNHAKINGIYNKIKTATNFNQILKNFTPEGSVAHLIFDIDQTKKPDSDAETSEPVNYWIKITFNKNINWASKPKVVIAGTFMHELIHAEILRQLLAVANSNGNINEATLLEYAKNHKHIELFNAYVKSKTNDADFQHQYMAQKYITTIVNFLKQVYGTQYTDIEYKTVAWMSSLKGTKAWNLLPQSERDLYINTFNTNYWLWEL